MGLKVKAAHLSLDSRVNVAQKEAIISCCAQTAPHTPFRLMSNRTGMMIKVVTLKRKDLGKESHNPPLNLRCLKFHMTIVITLSIQKEVSI